MENKLAKRKENERLTAIPSELFQKYSLGKINSGIILSIIFVILILMIIAQRKEKSQEII